MANGINRGTGGGSAASPTTYLVNLDLSGNLHVAGNVVIDGTLTVAGGTGGGGSVTLDQPSALTLGATTVNSATVGFTQTGTVPDGWLIYLKTSSGSFSNSPYQTLPYSGVPSVQITGLQPASFYDIEIVAFKGSVFSQPTFFRFQTAANPVTPTTNRVVTISSAMKASAIAAANAAANGSKNAAYTASIVATLGASPKAVLKSLSLGDLHIEVVNLTASATGISVAANAASFTSSVATNPNVTQDIVWEIRKASDATVVLSIPAGVASQADAKYILSGAWTLNQQVRRSSAFVALLPTPAFDTATSSGVTTLINDMVLPFEAQPNQHIFGYGNGSSGVLSWIRPTVKGYAAYATAGLDPNVINHINLPWFLFMPAIGHVNNGTWLIEAWAYDTYVYLDSVGWQHQAGYPTDDFQPVFYGSGSPTSGTGAASVITLANGHKASYPPDANSEWVMHNSIGPGLNFANPLDVRSVHVRHEIRFCPRPGMEAQFDPSQAKVVCQIGDDSYPDSYPAGFIAAGNGASGFLITATQRRATMTMFRDPGGLIQIPPPLDPSLSATYPPSQAWLVANPPPGYV